MRDWDVTVEASQPEAHAALRDLSPTLHANFGIHADHKVVCFDETVEVICRFAFFTESGIVRIPTILASSWNGFPVGSPEAWAVAYLLMIGEKPGRAEKAEALLEYVRRHGNLGRAAAMLDQPLPPAIRERLERLLREIPAR